MIKRLMTAFHTGLRVTIVNDGRMIGLILGDELVQSIVQFPVAYNHVNWDTAACASGVALTNCTANTLVSGASGTTWLWADGTHIAAGAQGRLGELARVRATNNPF